MSTTYISMGLRQLVEGRASQCCEYCLLPALVAFLPHEIDHVIAEKHGGATEEGNLALACWRYNRHKGSDLGSFDPRTGDFSFLYNPRLQQWGEHFLVRKATILGLTAEGRTSVRLLQCNTIERVQERLRLITLGLYPAG